MKKFSKIIMIVIIALSCVAPLLNTIDVKAYARTYTYAYVDTDDLSTRTCPSFDCDRVNHDEGRAIYLNYPRVVEILENYGEWAKVRYNYWGFTYEGYMYTYYLNGIRTVELDQNYMNELIKKGFPDTYVEKLAKMHAIHPNWNFEVSYVGTTLDYATGNEFYPVGKNLISTTNTDQLSTDPEAYNGWYIQFEPGWYQPSYQTLSYYLDARNFLDDNSIFMFEQLSYSPEQTESVVQGLLNGTFMAGSYWYNGESWTYARTFVEAGKRYNVSPVHLAARVLQEQGSDGSLTTDMESDGKIYHNYFNFNAYGSTTEQIVSGALSYAKKRGWDSPYAAIFGGAEDISDGYIDNGQDTLFYQKFNLVGDYSRYSNQYMANIQAPYSEGYSEYISYFTSGLINQPYTFKIPVYDGMSNGTQIATKSNNNNLSNLTVSSCTLNPSFVSSISVYNCSVDNSVTKVNVNATLSDGKAKLEGTGSKDLNVGTNTIELYVTAEDGSKKTYTVTVTRREAGEPEPVSTNINTNPKKIDKLMENTVYKNDDDILTGFTLSEDISNVIRYISNATDATVKMYDENDKEITSGTVATGQKIVVTKDVSKTYYVAVYGDVNGDGKISAIDFSKVKAHIINVSKLKGAYSEAADITKDGKISALDFSKVKAHILGISTIIQKGE